MDSSKNNKNIKIKKVDDVEDLKIDDFELKDVSFDMDVKTDSEPSVQVTNSENKLNDMQDVSDSKISDNGMLTDSSSDGNLSSSDMVNSTDDFQNDDILDSNMSDTSQQDFDNDGIDELEQNLTNIDDRSLKEKAQDLKEDINQAKENLENAKNKIEKLPENIKNKKEDIQRKANKAKENIQNLPENARKKADDVKNRARQAKENIQNFPKNKDELASAFKDRLKKSAGKAKEKARDTANRAIENGKENLKDRIENSKPVKTAKKAKKAYNNTKKAIKTTKKAAKATAKVAKQATKVAAKTIQGLIDLIVATFPISLIVILVVALVAIVIVVAVAVAPGKDDIKDSYESENYSEKDIKTLGKLRNLYQKYPNSDAALAMVTVVYPYYETLQDGSVTYYINTNNKNWDPSKTYKDYQDISDYEDKDESEDEEDCKDDECDTAVGDDVYLELFRKWSYRRKFKKLLKKSNSMSEDEFTEYLKNDYFKSESGYKALFNFVDEDKQNAFADAIIEDLKEKKNYFKNYIYDVVVCSNSSTTLGYSYAGDIIQGEAVVVLKDSASGNFSTIKSASSLYGTEDLTLDLKRYVMGVAYAEVGDGVKREAEAKAVMITAKSFVLGRTGPGSSDVGKGFKPDYSDGKTIFYMRASTADQDFCDVYEGCKSGSRYAKELQKNSYNSETLRNTKSGLDAESLANLEKWYDETAGEFIYDSKNKAFAGNQYDDYNSYCKVGSCLSQTKAASLDKQGKDYTDILYGSQGAFSDSKFEKFDMETKTLSKESSSCEALTTNGQCGISDDKFIYYSQYDEKWKNDTFCGRTVEACGQGGSATIGEAACGVTSMSMVIANLTDETSILPTDTMNEAKSGGYCGCKVSGTDSGYFKAAADKHGLTYKSMSVDKKGIQEALEILKSGGLIIANVGSASPFTRGGHYIVIRKVDGEGNVYVGDPSHPNFFKNPYDINDFVNKGWITHGWWGFTSGKSVEIVKNYCQPETKNTGEKGDATGMFIRPIKSNNACNSYPTYSSGSWHGGGDIPTPTGTSVLAADGGTVESVKYLSYSYGHHVVINHGNGYKSWYAHMSTISVKKGDKVSQGQEIGKSGSTGNSSGPHLHFEVRKSPYSHTQNTINVCNYIGKNKKYAN